MTKYVAGYKDMDYVYGPGYDTNSGSLKWLDIFENKKEAIEYAKNELTDPTGEVIVYKLAPVKVVRKATKEE